MSRYLAALLLASACAKPGMTPEVRSQISAQLASAEAPIRDCYQKSLTTNRRLRGMMVVQLAAQPDGSFSEITLRRDEPNDPVLRFCVIGELAKLRLDKPPGQRILVESVPIKFEWDNPE
jgi:hypothetical protein